MPVFTFPPENLELSNKVCIFGPGWELHIGAITSSSAAVWIIKPQVSTYGFSSFMTKISISSETTKLWMMILRIKSPQESIVPLHKPCETTFLVFSSLIICFVQFFFLFLHRLHTEAPLVGGSVWGWRPIYRKSVLVTLCAWRIGIWQFHN